MQLFPSKEAGSGIGTATCAPLRRLGDLVARHWTYRPGVLVGRLEPEAVMECVNTLVAPYKRVRRIEFIETIPRPNPPNTGRTPR
jgi:hypothetical protein